MGTKNRERRRQKQAGRKRARRQQAGSGWAEAGYGPLGAELLLVPLVEAVHHDQPDAELLVDAFASAGLVGGGRPSVAACLRAALTDGVAECRQGGWTPEELIGAGRRRVGSASSPLLAAALRAELRRHDRRRAGSEGAREALAWAAEVERLGAGGFDLNPSSPEWRRQVHSALRLVGLLWHLPALPELSDHWVGEGDQAADGSQRRILERVRGLLAKAEATGFPKEADALTAKAQELLGRYSLDRALIEAGDTAAKRPRLATRRIWIDDPYLRAKASLLNQVALANRSRAVLMGDLNLSIVTGHPDDLDTVEMLYTSLLVQATGQLSAAGASAESRARTRSRSYRQSFLVAFAIRIGQRLCETTTAGEAAAAAAAGDHGAALVPVLASRRSAADEAVAEMFGELESTGASVSDALGWAAGTAAAELANLATSSGIAGGRRGSGDTSGSGAPAGGQLRLDGFADLLTG